jgi:outer membrane protein, heavy metal efflux system
MFRRKNFPWVVVAFAVAWAAAASPEPSPGPSSLSSTEALRLTRERNPDILAARSGLEVAEAQRQIAGEFPNPVFGWQTSKIPTDGSSTATGAGNGWFERSYDSVLSLGQLVEVGGKRRERRRSSDEGVAVAAARLLDAERVAITATLKAYVAVVVARTNESLSIQTAESFAKTARLAADREEAGDISSSERAQVEIAAGRFQADVALAEVASRNAVQTLEAILNLPTSVGSRALTDDLATLTAATAHLSIPEPLGDGQVASRRPDLLALEAALRKAEADLALQKAFRIPDPTLLAQYERQPPDQRNTVGLGVSIPIPAGNRNGGAIRAAQAALRAAQRELELGRSRFLAELAANRAALTSASARATNFVDVLLPKAEKVRQAVEFAYREGAASLLELLEAERSANEIRLAAASAQGDLITARSDFAASRMLPIEREIR